MAFTYPDAWIDVAHAGISRKATRKAAKNLQAMLETNEGRDGISWMAQRYASTIAAIWRRAAAGDEYAEHAEVLLANADDSERLG